MIQAIILDIDGIIVGEKVGFNSPYPHPKVLQKLQNIQSKGIPIILCTAKPHYSIGSIIQKARLANPHITDGGSVVIDPIGDVVVKKYCIEQTLAKEVLDLCISNKVYVEFYTTENYFIPIQQVSDITKKHAYILEKQPVVLQDFVEASFKEEITKIMPIALDENDKKRVDELLTVFKDKLSISWALHPVALPLQFCVITSKQTSKKLAAQETIQNLKIDFANVLGIGDSTSDWQFISVCGYGATLKNGTEELKELLKTKENYFIGPSVNENGILDVFKHFNL